MKLKSLVGAFVAILCFQSFALATPGVSFEGQLLDSAGNPLTGSTLFRLQVRSPDVNNCLLYSENQTAVLNAGGEFSLTLNSAGLSTRTDGNSYPFDRAFSNSGAFALSVGSCVMGTSYTPGSSDGRVLAVEFKTGTMAAFEAIPPQAINHVPYSFQAGEISGFGVDKLVRVADGVVAPLSNANYNKILDLMNGKLQSSPLPTMNSNQVLGWNGSAWTSVDPLSGVQAFAKAALPTCAPGQFLRDSGAGALVCATPAGGGAGTVTSVTSGVGLTGGPITSSGTIGLATLGSGGSGYKITYDVYGRVTAATALAEADIPTLSAAGKVSGSSITGTIAGSTSINTSGSITAATVTAPAASFAGLSSQALKVYEPGNVKKVTIQAPSGLAADYDWTLPPSAGAAGSFLSTNGSGQLSWVTTSSAGITSLTGDVAASGTGAVNATISNAAITFAKMAPLSANSLIGRGNTNGQPEMISIGSGLQLSGSSLSATATDTFATLLGVCGNGYIPFKSAGAWTCALATSASTNDSLIQRDSSGSFMAASAKLTSSLKLKDGSSGGEVTLSSPTGFGSYSLVLPTNAGSSGEVLSTNGSGVLSWTAPAGAWAEASGNVYRSSGSVGIGITPSGSHALEVNGAARIGSINTIGAGSVSTPAYSVAGASRGMFGPTTNTLGFSTNSVERLRIAADGSVGIGTTSPTAAFEVANSAPNALMLANGQGEMWPPFGYAQMVVKSHAGYPGIGFKDVSGNFTGMIRIDTGSMEFVTGTPGSPARRMVITQGGNVGVGIQYPTSSLQVVGYTQLDTISASPPPADCDDSSEYGRMKVNPTTGLLYICVASGWISK